MYRLGPPGVCTTDVEPDAALFAAEVAAGAALPDALAEAVAAAALALARMALACSGVIVVKEVTKLAVAVAVAVAALESVATVATETMLESVAADAVAVAVDTEPAETAGGGGGGVEPDEPADPVMARELSSSGTVSMNAMVGPAITVLVAWTWRLLARGLLSEVMYNATGPLTPWGTTHWSMGNVMDAGAPPNII